jgi:hypothetical protein
MGFALSSSAMTRRHNRTGASGDPQESHPAGYHEGLGDVGLTLLLDTHVWIWSQEYPEKLGHRTAA